MSSVEWALGLGMRTTITRQDTISIGKMRADDTISNWERKRQVSNTYYNIFSFFIRWTNLSNTRKYIANIFLWENHNLFWQHEENVILHLFLLHPIPIRVYGFKFSSGIFIHFHFVFVFFKYLLFLFFVFINIHFSQINIYSIIQFSTNTIKK